MVDAIKLKLMKNKPTLDDIVESETDSKTDIVFRVSMVRANKDQEKILKQADAVTA